MNLQLIKKNIYHQQKRCIVFEPISKKKIGRIIYRKVRFFITNYKVPLLVKIYWYGIFWATLFGGCYGCKKALSNDSNDVDILDETIKKARVACIIWTTLPFHMIRMTYHYVKFNME